MAGDSAVRSLLEKMTECASAAYLRMLERFIMFISYCLSYLSVLTFCVEVNKHFVIASS